MAGTTTTGGMPPPMAPGGSTGQVLTKASNANYDTEWTTPAGGGGTVTDVTASAPLSSTGGATPDISIGGGTAGQVLTSNGASAPTFEDLPAPPTVPSASSSNGTSIGTAAVGVSTDYARADHVHDGSLSDLDDVSATAPTLGQVLAWGGAEWAPSSLSAYDQMLYVADGADAALANGSPVYPFASISAALASISDASPTKRYTVLITAGEYTETGTVNLKPNVFLCGVVPDAVRITATTWALDATFTGGADNRTGIHNCIVNGAVSLNFTTVTSTAGKFYARNTLFNGAVTLTGYNNAIVQAQFSGCQFFGLVTVQGVNVGVANDNIHFAGLTLTQSPFGGVPTIWNATGGTLGGTLTATTTVSDFNRRISVFAKSFWMGTVTITGPSTYLDYTVDCLPVAGASVSGGASLVLINPATSVGANTALSNLDFPTAVNNPIIPATTSATNMGDWNKQWMFSFGYVHLSSGTELYVASAGASAAADSAGRAIYIEADTYGLNANVDGGDINITTQAGVSGTGVRGKIALNATRVEVNGAYKLPSADGTVGQVMTTDGAGQALWTTVSGGGGTIGGTIAANEVAFGTGADTIGGSANLEWNNATSVLSIVGDASDCLTVASLIDGQFLAVSPTMYTLVINDPLTPTSSATMGPGDVAVGDGSASGNVQAGLVGVTENTTGNRLTLTAPAGLGTITSEDSATNIPAPLNVVCDELQVNGSAGTSGYVLTSNGTGAAPTWQAAGGGGGGGAIDVQAYTADATWTKPAGAQFVEVIAVGGGGGGGSGRLGAASSTRGGGAGGGGAGITRWMVPAAALGATVAVTVGAGGAGGAPVLSSGVNGAAGTAGTASTFGSHVYAAGGAGGAGGAGTTAPVGGAGATAAILAGGNGGNGGAGATGGPTVGLAALGAAGGGGGGSVTSGNTAQAGQTGGAGSPFFAGASALAGGAGGAATGVNGSAGTSSTSSQPFGGGGGGGGGANHVASGSAIGGTGGAGGSYGAGGGGGGGGTTSTAIGQSGEGGAGASGIVYVITY